MIAASGADRDALYGKIATTITNTTTNTTETVIATAGAAAAAQACRAATQPGLSERTFGLGSGRSPAERRRCRPGSLGKRILEADSG